MSPSTRPSPNALAAGPVVSDEQANNNNTAATANVIAAPAARKVYLNAAFTRPNDVGTTVAPEV